jgi:hypothetical protein
LRIERALKTFPAWGIASRFTMFGTSPPLHPSALQPMAGRMGGFDAGAYEQPMPHATAYGGVGFGLSGIGPMGTNVMNGGMSMMGTPMGAGTAMGGARAMGGAMPGMAAGGMGGMGAASMTGAGGMGMGMNSRGMGMPGMSAGLVKFQLDHTHPFFTCDAVERLCETRDGRIHTSSLRAAFLSSPLRVKLTIIFSLRCRQHPIRLQRAAI